MNLLIYGSTEVAFLLASRLHHNHNITLLTDSPPEERFENLDINLVKGSAGDIGLLEEIEAATMELFIACSKLDEANIVACWTVKKLGDIETICLLSKADLNHNLTVQAGSSYQTPYDIDSVIWPEQLLMEDIFRIISVPEALDVEYFAGGRAKLFEYRINGDSLLANRKVKDCGFPKDVLVAGIMRDSKLFIPDGQTVIEAEDRAFFIGRNRALDAFAAAFFRTKSKVEKVSIIGGGSVGFMLAQQLEQIDIEVKIIEKDPDRCLFLADSLGTTLVLEGDGTDLDLLESEAVADADACICITNNDEKNLLCSLLLRQLGAKRIVTRAETMQNFRLFEHVGIDVVVSPKASSLANVINRVQTRDVDIVALLEGDRGELLRLTLPEDYSATAIKDLQLPVQALVGIVIRGHRVIIPNGETVLIANDRLHIFVMKEETDSLKTFFFA